MVVFDNMIIYIYIVKKNMIIYIDSIDRFQDIRVVEFPIPDNFVSIEQDSKRMKKLFIILFLLEFTVHF